MNVEKATKLVSELFFSRTQAHVFHLQSKSYAEHKALESYYEGIVGLVDTLIETYQGTNPIIKIYTNDFKFAYEGNPITYFEGLLLSVGTNRTGFGTDSDLQNVIDEIVSEIKSLLYKLKNLK